MVRGKCDGHVVDVDEWSTVYIKGALQQAVIQQSSPTRHGTRAGQAGARGATRQCSASAIRIRIRIWRADPAEERNCLISTTMLLSVLSALVIALTAVNSEDRDNCPQVSADRRCSCWGSDVTCEGLGVNDLSFLRPLSADYDRLYVNRNNLGSLDTGALDVLANITWLTMQHNHITKVDAQALVPLAALQYLDVSYNELEAFDLKDVQLNYLHTLDLSHNRLLRLKLNPSLQSLLTIVLEDNRLKITEDTFEFPNIIERVKLSGNEIEDDLRFLRSLPELITVWVAGNNISTVPEDTFKMNKNIQYLRLDSNNILDLEFLKNLSRLRGLNLTSNQLESISANTFENLSRLEHVYLDHNSISDTTFVAHISNNLATLLLSNNAISEINSSSFRGKNRLKWLSLSNNDLRDLTFITELSNLETLYVDNNNLEEISKYVLNKTKIKLLDLSNNNIDNIDFVPHCQYLKNLYMTNNNLSEINQDTLANSLIQELDFSGNRLKSIEFIRNLPHIKELYLANNNILSIPEDILKNNSALEKLNVSGNPIDNLKFIFYASRMTWLSASDCSIQSTDEVALKCSRSVQVVTKHENATLSFIKSIDELWEQCYGTKSRSENSPNPQWTVLITTNVLALSCLLILLCIILVETVIRCRRKRFYSYLQISDDNKKIVC